MNVGPSLSTVSRLYDSALDAARPLESTTELPEIGAGQQSPAPSFADSVAAVAEEAVEALFAGEQAANDMIAGKADPHSVVEALAATEMALEMAVSVRDKVVQAYQEILRMPV